jgi:inorganic triphosphatase YgiF
MAKSEIMIDAQGHRQELSAQLVNVAEQDVTALKARIDEAEQKDAETKRALEQQVRDARAAEEKIREVMGRVGAAIGMAGPIAGLVSERLGNVASETGNLLTRVSAFQETLDETRASMRDDRREAKAESERLRADVTAVDRQQADLKRMFESLDEGLQQRVVTVAQTLDRETMSAIEKAEPAKQRELLESELRKRGLTDQDIQALKGMSTEEIVALLLSLVGAGGAGRVFLGKSRASGELEMVKKELKEVKEKQGK